MWCANGRSDAKFRATADQWCADLGADGRVDAGDALPALRGVCARRRPRLPAPEDDADVLEALCIQLVPVACPAFVALPVACPHFAQEVDDEELWPENQCRWEVTPGATGEGDGV